VQIAATVSWQSHWALQPLDRLDAHEHAIAEQGRSFFELYGAVLVGALAACDRARDREADAAAEVELPAVDSVVEVWDEARDEREGPAALARAARRRDLDLRHLPGSGRAAAADARD
jgi:hypothetical protein